MSFLRKKIDQIKRPFAKGEKWEKFAPAVNAFDTFLFVPNHTTQKGAHVRDAVDLKRTMVTVILALVPALIYGIYNTGYQYFIQTGEAFTFIDAFIHGAWKIVPMIIVSYAVGLTIEFIFAIYRGHEVNEGYLVTGLLIPMIMPVDIPLWMVGISTAFAVLIAKEAFGGTGMNILNPALTARAFAFFAYPTYMSGNKVWVSEASNVDAISGETILGSLAAGSDVSYSMLEMFQGSIPGSIAETSALWIGVGALILILTGVGSWRIIIGGILGASIMGFLFNLWGANALMSFNWMNHLVVGGFAFGIVFMATDPVSAAQTNKGKWIYGVLVGIFCILIRVFNPAYPEGVMLAILLMNVFAPTIDHYVVEANISKRKKRWANAQLKTA
ncbi:NADH:ubiquinone reductase (Na(+)-transporting) subunit B [Candidatus Arcticimaribacter forsetii]|uniref:NADH:ubiquinone reductase (Na(+)-transporting) subunit B n=1 Tax=Candidatus Arcticimaribacter forsetii TaxID=2820661 RepID=UPI00207728A8|nr:NADH:ubiquinone reductase (Na(+)-transporting) subunit B [Candidatus Arcticimaribacter forsetii]MDA8640516.1 NADH:ubiquinone reductase (Na(+)-transporting) subunit B [Flavobacteriaceae bacterium]MDB2326056.1 NADH:ubiquinone reductase (Na(+)-transporting) subunit B [Flavobacteriaceae bacterium]MDB2329790.1 NADH:ubiquinone reductase (Na(+)-transporting) subunit B [Flavobacteriaceae bacterium]MDB4674886.1 NADH:ubiquinone reductase (Na(+)-transporting) subunit B [Flavobacteriaceae bacterium]